MEQNHCAQDVTFTVVAMTDSPSIVLGGVLALAILLLVAWVIVMSRLDERRDERERERMKAREPWRPLP